MATFNKSKSCEEFWGAKVCKTDYEFEESYEGEIFEMIKDGLLDGTYDCIPSEIEVKAERDLDPYGEEVETIYFDIDPDYYLTDDQYQELEDLVRELYPDDE